LSTKSIIETERFKDKKAAILRFKIKRIEYDVATRVENELKDALIQLGRDKESFHIILSFKYVDFVDMNGVKSILRFWKHLALNHGAVLVFAACNLEVSSFFHLCKLNHIVNIHPFEEDAIKHAN